jgi:phage tail-like protein
MTCAQGPGSFRVLDGVAGWEVAEADRLVGLEDPEGLRLGLRAPRPGMVHREHVFRCVLDRRLAIDGAGTWYLAAGDRLLRLTPCTTSFEAVPIDSDDAPDICAVAFAGGLLAVADREHARVRLLRGAERVVADVDLRPSGVAPTAVAITRFAELVVAGGHDLVLVGTDGIGRAHVRLPATGNVLGVGPACLCGTRSETDLVVVTDACDGWCSLWAVDLTHELVRRVDEAALRCCAGWPELVLSKDGFCLERSTGGVVSQRCFSWDGKCHDTTIAPIRAPLEVEGHLVTTALDSGIDGCQWQRVRIELEPPRQPHASVTLELVSLTAAGEEPAEQDWQTLTDTADGMVQQPPGRFLRLRLTLRGDGTVTPVVRSVRLDFEQATSLDRLPEVYRQDPEAADFGRRFLAMFDSVVGGIDDAVSRAVSRLDPSDPAVADEVLPALGRWLGVDVDPSWPAARTRDLLVHASELAAGAGTVAGLTELLRILFAVNIAVEEMGRSRPWGALGRACRRATEDKPTDAAGQLGEVRLATRSRSAVRLGSSVLGRTPIDGSSDPDRAIYRTGAHRVRVHVPAGLQPEEREKVRSLVAANLPAALAAEVRFARRGFLVSTGVMVGIETSLAAPGVPVLRGDEDHHVVLGRGTVLAGGVGGGAAVTVGRRAVVGMNTTPG